MYYEHAQQYYELMANDSFVEVTNDELETSISIKTHYPSVWSIVRNEGRSVSKACFNNAFQSALSKLQHHIEFSKELDQKKENELNQDSKEYLIGTKATEEEIRANEEDMLASEYLQQQEEENYYHNSNPII